MVGGSEVGSRADGVRLLSAHVDSLPPFGQGSPQEPLPTYYGHFCRRLSWSVVSRTRKFGVCCSSWRAPSHNFHVSTRRQPHISPIFPETQFFARRHSQKGDSGSLAKIFFGFQRLSPQTPARRIFPAMRITAFAFMRI